MDIDTKVRIKSIIHSEKCGHKPEQKVKLSLSEQQAEAVGTPTIRYALKVE